MKPGVISALIVGLALTMAAYGQSQNPGSSDNQAPSPAPGGQYGPGGGMGRGGGYGPGGFAGVMGRSVAGTVTEVATDHYTIKTFSGQTYTVKYSANTHMMKQPPGMGRGGGQGRRGGGGGNPPQQIQASDIKVGDSIAAMGEIDSSAKSVGAAGILLLDPARAQQMAQMEADYGKTWLMGRITAIDGTKVTVLGGPDNASHTFAADENTTFRMRRNPITLADLKVGDMVRAEGAVKSGVFTATMVNDIGTPGQGRGPRNGPPTQ